MGGTPGKKNRNTGKKLSLAFLLELYYTVQVPAGVMKLVDVVDSKCASSFIVPAEKVVAVQALFMYNEISKFNIPPAHPS